ncbi:coiled-coil and C2 domain-containing protein 1-like [Oscarella lobularis]|uniref:coiled-coil and C2 domain-containing protein 1-like n=1 Tax=Oscarella lobularis TaxID=121494 RepID=UPI0033139FF6
MFRSKKGNSNPSEEKRTKKKDLNAMFGFDMDADADDDDLEAELLALTGNPAQQSKKKQAKKDVSLAEIQAMAEEGLRDVDEDDMSDVDEDDDLLSELADLTGGEAPDAVPMPTSESTPRSPNAGIVKLIEERKSLYERAVARANADGDKSKIRRFSRSLKTCEELLKAAQKGQHVDEAEVPPPVHVPSKEEPLSNPRPQPAAAPPVSPDGLDKPKPAPRPVAAEKPKPAPRPSTTTPEQMKPAPAPPAAKRPVPTPRSDAMTAQPVVVVSNPEPSDEGDADDLIKAVLSLLHERLTQYRSAAIQAKKGGDKGAAVEFMKKAKYFEQTVASIQKEEEVDLSQIPSAPPGFKTSAKSQLTLQKLNEMAPDSESVPAPSPSPSPSPVPQEIPSKPTSLLEGLEQRLAKYQSAVELAKNDGQSGKVRRMNRIVGQYKEAIQACKSKKSYAYDELPAPPGFPPLPLSHQSPLAGALTASAPSIESSRLVQTSPRPATLQTFPAPRSTNDEQLDRLVHRQTELKKAALQAKHDGNVDLAKKIFFQAKSMDQMIEAARGGIKVDMSQMPSLSPSPQPPAVEAAAPKINVERTEADDETLARLESTLSKQVDLAKRMELYYNGTGHLKEAAEYRNMVRSSQRDLDAVKNALSYQKPVPQFHYEDRAFSKLNVFPELSESEVEVVVVRGINLPLPKKVEAKDFDTYVTVEFPYPQEDSPSAKTSVIKGTDNPTYEHSMKFPIDRKQRAFGRALKRRPVRAELWHSRSWSLFRGDQSLGEVAIRIEALETKCEVHECADLTANRKLVGGKLEIRVRLRQPLQGDDVNIVNERWLVIDHPPSSASLHRRSPSPRRESSPESETTSIGPTISSIMSFRVVQAELQSAEKTIAQMKSHRQKPPKVYDHRVRECREKLSSIQTEMKRGGKAYIASYVKRLAGKVAEEQALAAQLVRAGSRTDAAAALHRKKIMENEIKEWKVKFHI